MTGVLLAIWVVGLVGCGSSYDDCMADGKCRAEMDRLHRLASGARFECTQGEYDSLRDRELEDAWIQECD